MKNKWFELFPGASRRQEAKLEQLLQAQNVANEHLASMAQSLDKSNDVLSLLVSLNDKLVSGGNDAIIQRSIMEEVLEFCKFANYNLHSSLVPRLFPMAGELGFDDPRSSHSLLRALCLKAQDETLRVIEEDMSRAVTELDHKSFLLAALARSRKNGCILELGVFSGTTLNWLAEAAPERKLIGFDGFVGLPQPWVGYKTFDFNMGGEQPKFPQNVELLVGDFSTTLPDFAKRNEDIAMVHIDCDLYESTRLFFHHVGPYLKSDTTLVFDEYFNYPNFKQHEYKAFQEYLATSGKAAKWISISGERAACVLG